MCVAPSPRRGRSRRVGHADAPTLLKHVLSESVPPLGWTNPADLPRSTRGSGVRRGHRYDSRVTDLATWLGVAVSAASLLVAYATFRSGRNRTRIEYIRQTQTSLIPRSVAESVELTHDGSPVRDPALTVLRIVNAGDKAIEASGIESDLGFKFVGVSSIALAALVGSRPADLRPAVTVAGDIVTFERRLLNPGDLLVLQILSSGVPTKIEPMGRVSGLRKIAETSTPYPPGSGPEGEMLTFERFLWYVFTPLLLAGLVIGIPAAFGAEGAALTTWAVASVSVILAYFANTARLVRRRRLWRPW